MNNFDPFSPMGAQSLQELCVDEAFVIEKMRKKEYFDDSCSWNGRILTRLAGYPPESSYVLVAGPFCTAMFFGEYEYAEFLLKNEPSIWDFNDGKLVLESELDPTCLSELPLKPSDDLKRVNITQILVANWSRTPDSLKKQISVRLENVIAHFNLRAGNLGGNVVVSADELVRGECTKDKSRYPAHQNDVFQLPFSNQNTYPAEVKDSDAVRERILEGLRKIKVECPELLSNIYIGGRDGIARLAVDNFKVYEDYMFRLFDVLMEVYVFESERMGILDEMLEISALTCDDPVLYMSEPHLKMSDESMEILMKWFKRCCKPTEGKALASDKRKKLDKMTCKYQMLLYAFLMQLVNNEQNADRQRFLKVFGKYLDTFVVNSKDGKKVLRSLNGRNSILCDEETLRQRQLENFMVLMKHVKHFEYVRNGKPERYLLKALLKEGTYEELLTAEEKGLFTENVIEEGLELCITDGMNEQIPCLVYMKSRLAG